MVGASISRRIAAAAMIVLGSQEVAAQQISSDPIVVDGLSFALNGNHMSYRFHVDNDTQDLINDHFGGSVTEDGISQPIEIPDFAGWVGVIGRVRREFPDLGRGDFRTPAFLIKQSPGYTVSDFRYDSHDIVKGKPSLKGLPATFGDDGDVSTLVVHMYDNYSSVAADLSYSVFPKYDAIVRSVKITNKGKGPIQLEKLASFSIDIPEQELDMLEIKGDWAREGMRVRRKVDFGTQGFQSTVGYSSHLYNPFFSLISPTTTESHGDAWGFSLVYTGSFAVDVEKGSQGLTRAMIGLTPYQFSWPLEPGESFQSPECVAVYSNAGVGGMSRQYHRLYRKHLMKSKYAEKTRPSILNSYGALQLTINETAVQKLAEQSAELGVKLLVVDDGWFGNKAYQRINDTAGLGDWEANTSNFPNGLIPFIENVTKIDVDRSSEKLKFGLWFEPEMVNPNSTLYHEHPEWVIHAGNYPRSLSRHQLVLNLALPEVQEFVVASLAKFLRAAPISYVKWDNNRGIREMPTPNLDHQYMLGVYKVFQNLTSQFPDVLWEGCASGSGRFDPGILQWFPQVWTSDNMDPVDRIAIQFGYSLVYPPSAMGAHVTQVPDSITGSITPVLVRAHAAMMGGSFGLELNPGDLDEDEKEHLPGIMALAEKINPIVINGDFWRLALPEDTQYPAGQFISEDGSQVVLFAFQIRPTVNNAAPWFRLQGLDASARYLVNDTRTLSGATLMNIGIQIQFDNEYDSEVIMIEKQ